MRNKADRIRGLECRLGWLARGASAHVEHIRELEDRIENLEAALRTTTAIGKTLATLVASLTEDGLLDLTVDQGIETTDPDWCDGVRARQWDGQITVTALARNGSIIVNGVKESQ